MEDKYFETIQEFMFTQPARKLIVHSLKELLPQKGNLIGLFLSVILASLIALRIGFDENTIDIFAKVANKIINVQLAVFSCVFAVYSILLAFLSDGYMKRLGRIPIEGKTSMLKQSTMYYESALFLYFISISITGIGLIISDCIPASFSLTANLLFDNYLATILLFVYFAFTFRVFYELKSVIYNTIVLFRASIAYRFIDFSVEDNKQSDINNEKDVDK